MLNAEAASPTPTPTPTATPTDTSSEPVTRILVEGTLDDTYKPELANSPNRPEPLVDTPQTISIVPRKVIQDQNATNLRDILRNVPGVTLQTGEGGNTPGDNFIIRGFSARTDLYVDGVRAIDGFYRDPFNIEQVEVTKGPASVYTGRGSTGSSINVTTKQPGTREFFALDAGVDTDDYDRDAVDMNVPFKIFGGNTATAGRGDGSKDGTSSAPAVVSTDNAVAGLGWGALRLLQLGVRPPAGDRGDDDLRADRPAGELARGVALQAGRHRLEVGSKLPGVPTNALTLWTEYNLTL